jgi:hypothetical protein
MSSFQLFFQMLRAEQSLPKTQEPQFSRTLISTEKSLLLEITMATKKFIASTQMELTHKISVIIRMPKTQRPNITQRLTKLFTIATAIFA